MVKAFTHRINRDILLRQLPETMVSCYDDGGFDKEMLSSDIKWADVIGIGPGLGQSDMALELLRYVTENCQKPLVIDADGLNLLGSHPELFQNIKGSCIVTPHMGEMSRLTGQTVQEIAADRIAAAGELAKKRRVTCVLKDACTVTACRDGRFVINTTGNSGMATAGSGDVLTGMILGLLAAGMDAEEAAYCAVWLHGKAGDRARDTMGEASLLAEDIISAIPEVLKKSVWGQGRKNYERRDNCGIM